MSVDMVVVQRYFDKNKPAFTAAGMIGRALIFFVGPMVAVMFPKIVKSHAEQNQQTCRHAPAHRWPVCK